MSYYELNPEDSHFKTISVQTTYNCQMQCQNCYLGDMLNNPKYPNVNKKMLVDVLNRLPRRSDIRLIGAEPTMNPDLINIIKIIRANGHRPSLLTNGLKLRNENYVKELKSSGLNLIGVSMNGGLDDNVYMEFDNGKYAKQKTLALEHCFKYNILPHVNVIIDPTNIHIVEPLKEFILNLANKYGRRISPVTYPVMLRLKSIGKIGNYRDTHTYTLSEMMKLFPIEYTNMVDGYEEKRSVIGRWDNLLVKLTDWTLDEDGVPDANSGRRGILTDKGTIAPFFEFYCEKNK